MIAAIYARKSTDQSAVADEAKSVTRQIAHATAYAQRKGWTVLEACIFVDDGISGAEFANRPGFVRLMAALNRLPLRILLRTSTGEWRHSRHGTATSSGLSIRVFLGSQECDSLGRRRSPSRTQRRTNMMVVWSRPRDHD